MFSILIRYIFESLGLLVASILMNSIQYLKKINENGIKKMCRNLFAIQQNLTNITMSREPDLDHARQYYELLYLNPDVSTLFLYQNYIMWTIWIIVSQSWFLASFTLVFYSVGFSCENETVKFSISGLFSLVVHTNSWCTKIKLHLYFL